MADQNESKIVVDEDWKSQVQAEKDALSQQSPDDPAVGAGPAESASAAPAAADQARTPPRAAEERPSLAPRQPASQQLPPPTMFLLFSSLATQAMFALGQIADPQTGKSEVRLDEARHVIDTLQLLEEKTKGNLTPQESTLLSRLLYDLRMEFVAARDATAKA